MLCIYIVCVIFNKNWHFFFQYINCVSDGRKVQGPHYNLVRNRSLEPAFGSMYDLAKVCNLDT